MVFAKWLATEPKLLILDEPTSGVDINAKRDMRELVRAPAAQGVGVLLISSELEELMELSDRILVMAAGRRYAGAHEGRGRSRPAGASADGRRPSQAEHAAREKAA